MSLVVDRPAEVAAWASIQLGAPIGGECKAIGVLNGSGAIVGAIIFTNWNGSNMDATVVGRKCFTRNTIRFAADYVFNQLRYNRVTFRTKRSNKPVCRLLAKHIGSEGFEGTARAWYGPDRSDDAIIYRLDRQTAAKWCGVF